MRMDGRFDVRALLPLTAGLFVLTGVHFLDHVRQGRELPAELHVLGTVSLVAAVTVLILAIKSSDLAKPAAFLLGAGNVIGLLAVHVAPAWWPLSDSYGDAGVDALSWLIVIAMIVTGAALALKAWALPPLGTSRQESELAPASTSRSDEGAGGPKQ